MIVSHPIALKLSQVVRLKLLAARTGRNKSDLAREALEALFEKYQVPEIGHEIMVGEDSSISQVGESTG